MKQHIQIKTKNKNYRIVVEEGIINQYLKSKLESQSKIFIIIDDKVFKIIKKVEY